jgi:hypothetical protein
MMMMIMVNPVTVPAQIARNLALKQAALSLAVFGSVVNMSKTAYVITCPALRLASRQEHMMSAGSLMSRLDNQLIPLTGRKMTAYHRAKTNYTHVQEIRKALRSIA